MKRGQLLLAIILLIATLYLAAQFSRLEDFARILSAGQPLWVGWALVGLAAWQVTEAAQFETAHRAADFEQNLLSMLPVVAANNFVLFADPTGSLSTFALFIANARRHGLSPERSAVAVAFVAVFEFLAAAVSVALALAALAARGVLYPIDWLLALPLIAFALGQYAVLLFALRAPARLARAAAWLAERINRAGRRLARRELVSLQRLEQMGANAAGGLNSLHQKGLSAQLRSLLYGMASEACLGAVLALLLLAFGQPASLAIVLAGLGVAELFSVVSPTPSGVGVVEAAVIVVLVSFGLGPAAALIVTLAFRGLTLWLPMLYGFVALHALGFRAMRPEEASPAPPA